MEDRKLSEKESLVLISQMINETKDRFEQRNGSIFLLWGYLTVTISVLVYVLLKVTGNYWIQLLWWLIPLIGYPVMLRMINKKNSKVTTFIDRTISNIWIVLGVCAVITPLLCFQFKNVPVLFIEALLINAGVAMSGLTLKFRPAIVMGFTGIFLSFGLWYIQGLEQILAFGFYIGLLMLITGHVMNYSRNKKREAAYV